MGIFDTFKLGQREFVNFMMALEQGYRVIPCEFLRCAGVRVYVCVRDAVLWLYKQTRAEFLLREATAADTFVDVEAGDNRDEKRQLL